jgi:NAD(P)-dependent dehydrogenase (short-subunit alcohol dehydrogenase family)
VQSQYLVVTGGSRGIGAAIARCAARTGFDVVLTYRSRPEAAAEVVRDVEAEGRRAEALPFEAGTDAAAELFTRIDAAMPGGRLAALVNNAGITGPIARIEAVDEAMLMQVMRTNVVAPMACMREAVRRMSARHGGAGGSIVNVSSRAAQIGGGGEWVHYAASKGAVDSITMGAARELGDERIRVNAVAPGLIETEIHAAAGAPDRLERLVAGVPMGRAGTADEVAEAVLWLISDAAAYISGAVLPISGGR